MQMNAKFLRDEANRLDQLSRELHASADQLEEQNNDADALRNLRSRPHGNAQAILSAMDVRQVSEAGGIKPGSSYAMDGNRAV
jgi:hypothetical protein